jgi:hypothetical protein
VQADLERFLSLVRRELGAEEAHIVFAADPEQEGQPSAPAMPSATDVPQDETRLYGHFADGRVVVARFAQPPADREAKQRRLEMLASTFDSLLEETTEGLPARKSRPPIKSSLYDELSALCLRAASVNSIVIDANSPVVWGAAYPEGVVPQAPLASSPRVTETPANDGTSPHWPGRDPNTEDGRQITATAGDWSAPAESEARRANLSKRALHAVRGLPELAALRKGKHVRHFERAGDPPLIAHSFAGIYLLVVVFDGAFDELRAERAILEALPRVERLVLALPPLDTPPSTGAGVIALRRPRRR